MATNDIVGRHQWQLTTGLSPTAKTGIYTPKHHVTLQGFFSTLGAASKCSGQSERKLKRGRSQEQEDGETLAEHSLDVG